MGALFDAILGRLRTDEGSGQQGQPGAAATVTVGDTTTGAAGTSASVTNSGTSSAAVLDFVIPKGADGVNMAVGSSAPTSATAGQVGDLRLDTSSGKVYLCRAIGGTEQSPTYTWQYIWQEDVITILAANDEPELDEGAYVHKPASAPTYTLPAVSDNTRTHEIVLEVEFAAFARYSTGDGEGYYAWKNGTALLYTSTATPTAGTTVAYSDTALETSAGTIALYDSTNSAIAMVGSCSFVDSNDNALTPMSTPTIKPGTVIDFLCRWSPSLAKWCIMPVVMS